MPYLVKGLRSKDLNCKTSALRLVWLALAAKIEPKDVETAYVHGLTVQAAPGSDKGMMEGLLDSGFVAIEEMMRQQRAGELCDKMNVSFRFVTCYFCLCLVDIAQAQLALACLHP